MDRPIPALPDGVTLRHDWRGPADRALVMAMHRKGYLDYDDRFTAADVDRLSDLVGGMVDEAGMGDGPHHRVWFAERGGPNGAEDCLGCIGLVRRGDRGQLRWLIVLPGARGLGLGRRLVGEVLREAACQGLTEVFLHTAPGLHESMALYRSFGFETVRTVEKPLWHGHGTDVEMRLRL